MKTALEKIEKTWITVRSSSFLGNLASVQLHALMIFSLTLTACGPGAPTYISGNDSLVETSQSGVRASGSANVSSADAAETTEENANPSAPAETPATAEAMKSASTPAPAPAITAIRTLPSAQEKTAMSALYGSVTAQGGCVDCHGALATSTRKGRTAAQIQAVMGTLPHRNVAAANKWPRDVADTSNDGVDQAQLFASALAELLK